ncbi:helix-hairpin-helix domain-containing protein [Haloferula sp. BvORR071]|uniref:ComEA family DNA-binding protein n=1 Tax=Haloferula sp. BvORR071 TaxID=1396141 RepID=UPI0005528517|nr:helix-hairpin-helix domain-containing protein [Haloferula sp. BvORR071]
MILLTALLCSAGSLSAAEKATPAKEAAAKPAEKKGAEAKPAEKKPGELSDSDKALVEHATKESGKLSVDQKKKLLDLVNTGDDKALGTIPGIGDSKAAQIKKARPLKGVEDLIMVDGIGKKTFDGIVQWTAGGMKEATPEPKKEPAKKPEPKKEPATPKTPPTPAKKTT